MSDVWDGRDPLRVFEVEQRPYLIFYVTIVKGHNITKGYWKDTLDTPDPFVKVTIKTAPNGTRLTKPVNNDANPDWNETFKFFLDPTVDNEMEITLVDANYLLHETISTKKIKISNMAMEKFQQKIQFSEKSAVDIEMWAEIDNTTELRYSLALCKGELHFIEKRRNCVFQAMKEILGDDAPRTINEVPTIGVLGSGGGFRALTAFSGVMGALVDSRISDMVMYNAGLSGSTWYLSSLYSHPDWPQKSPRELRNELRDSIESSPSNTPASLRRFWDRVKAKCDQGQPVSLTDLFGHLVGETLLQGRLEAKLTDQQEKLKEGNIPLPMYAGVHVKKEVSAKVFHEWIEFTPYEIGIMKYGTYMPAEMFGSKFFLGHVVKKYEESPLHFLQGIWGSAYCVRLKRYFGFGKKDDEKENSQEERDELDNELNEELPVQDSGSSDTSESEDDESTADANDEHEKRKKQTDENRLVSIFRPLVGSVLDCIPFWRSIDGRAAVVFNFLRGLSFQRYNKHEAKAQIHFDEIFEMYPTSKKKLYVVDAGLAFSSPYPLLLRPQRAVDLVLSFDYSSRDHDKTSLFSELLLAEEWARLNKVPFPVIDPTIADRERLKECYVFENPNDPKCPIVMHFVILNITFREFKAPGVPRSTEEEKDYANFDIFDDPNDTYSTFNFQYTNQAFDRLADLMEFNTLLCKELIVENIKKCVKKRAI
ncbi:cytosolic phospholipase A2-like isoform X2 [Mercenaria mercenaria]|uniref:cytosolic phospholipase A2-like isoform X2 n=1 Tax=Mercenaria mercenaria TaxID=6596 RepID=UPI00234EDF6C|nr:cytosolic phospholipase A2-like isoform X2 [Mercenaria mercenaria]